MIDDLFIDLAIASSMHWIIIDALVQ